MSYAPLGNGESQYAPYAQYQQGYGQQAEPYMQAAPQSAFDQKMQLEAQNQQQEQSYWRDQCCNYTGLCDWWITCWNCSWWS